MCFIIPRDPLPPVTEYFSNKSITLACTLNLLAIQFSTCSQFQLHYWMIYSKWNKNKKKKFTKRYCMKFRTMDLIGFLKHAVCVLTGGLCHSNSDILNQCTVQLLWSKLSVPVCLDGPLIRHLRGNVTRIRWIFMPVSVWGKIPAEAVWKACEK